MGNDNKGVEPQDIRRLGLSEMKVKVRFYGSFARIAGRSGVVKIREGSTLAKAVERIFETYHLGRIRLQKGTSLIGYVRIFVNDEVGDADRVIQEGDEITIYPPISGG